MALVHWNTILVRFGAGLYYYVLCVILPEPVILINKPYIYSYCTIMQSYLLQYQIQHYVDL